MSLTAIKQYMIHKKEARLSELLAAFPYVDAMILRQMIDVWCKKNKMEVKQLCSSCVSTGCMSCGVELNPTYVWVCV